MNKIEVLIVEDEYLLAHELGERLMALDTSVSIVGYLGSIAETVEWFQTKSCDILFLDIHLNDGLSFSIFDKITIKCPIIFITAYDQYAIQAFDVNSISYLLKPFSINDLEKAWLKYKTLLTQPQMTQINELLTYFRKEKGENTDYKNRLLVSLGNLQKPMKISDIACFMAEERYVFAITNKGERYFCEETLQELENSINPNAFFRVNRAFLINYDSVKELKYNAKGRLLVTLAVQIQEPIMISTAKVNDFKLWLKK